MPQTQSLPNAGAQQIPTHRTDAELVQATTLPHSQIPKKFPDTHREYQLGPFISEMWFLHAHASQLTNPCSESPRKRKHAPGSQGANVDLDQ